MTRLYCPKVAVSNQTSVISRGNADVRLNYNGLPCKAVPTNIGGDALWFALVLFSRQCWWFCLLVWHPRPTGLQFRMLDSVNALRSASGVGAVQLDSKLNAAAATHSKDMARQNRPWHFGSDGSSPIDRLQRVGYTGGLVGEVISETYETELETLAAWMDQPDTRRVIMSPQARNMGFSWHQESNGKIWWTLVMGG